jgi:hypothetical protein
MSVQFLVDDVTKMREYQMDWSAYLKEQDDRLVSSTWTTTGRLTLSDAAFTDQVASVYAGQGVPDTQVDLTNHVVTEGGREDERTIRLMLRQQ